jgi:glycosyltransferase involved in cell wall biosynthesis
VTAVHVIVPEGIDDRTRPSGGNIYDRRVCSGLSDLGWEVHVHAVRGTWPRPDAQSLAALARIVSGIPDGAVVLIDCLVGSPAPEVLVPEAARLRLVALVHMPLNNEREGALLSAVASVVTTSAWSRQALLQLYGLPGDRVHVAEPGVDPAELAPGTATAGAMLSVAAVIPGKGHDVLLDALALLSDRHWHCVCVGSLERDPAFVDGLRRRVLAAELAGRVRFPGPQTGAELAQSYGSADLLVLPSRGETYGMVVTEALARGLPVVAAAVGGIPDTLGRGADGTPPGLLVPPDDPGALHDALRAWLEQAELRQRLRAAARERRSSLSGWSQTAAVVSDALRTEALR